MGAFWETVKIVVVASWENLLVMAPYLLFGFAMAGVLSIVIPASLVERHLGGRGFFASLKAALFGVPLPLCSCGVIPVAASLRRQGAGKGPTAAFLIATPQTGADCIAATYSLMGPIYAVFSVAATFLSGLLGGVCVSLSDRDGDPPPAQAPASAVEGPRENVFLRAWRHGFVMLPKDIGGTLLFGLLLSGVIAVVIPEDFFSKLPGGGGGLGAMALMVVVGIPMYVCATASIPIAATLVLKGISPGAAMVFLMTGPVSNGASIAAVFKLLGKRSGIVYLVSLTAGALLAGFSLDLLFSPATVASQIHARAGACHGGHAPELSAVLYAVALVAVLVVAQLGRLVRRTGRATGSVAGSAAGDARSRVVLQVEGMTCSCCAGKVEQALRACAGAEGVTVDFRSGRAEAVGTALDAGVLAAAVAAAGYRATPEDAPPGRQP